jgi:NADPH-dependent 2,4-dienoyl-CoA reductase/sulfur reductase-like enzyme/nitrite reductase/ring-hydroxylating ferredoxin subunit
VSELRDGEMREVTVGTTPVLLVRLDGEYHALGARCSHHHAPLVEGALNGVRLVCPWHHACFDVRTGARQEPPALDSLPRYAVELDGDDVVVTVTEPAEAQVPTAHATDARTFVILGGGAAGQQAAEELRRLGFAGRLIMVTAEDALPYDRPHLSKEYLREAAPLIDAPHATPGNGHPHDDDDHGRDDKAEDDQHGEENAADGHGHDLSLRDATFYADRRIEVWRGRRATRLLTTRRIVGFAEGADLAYDALLVATGGVPRRLDVPGAELANVFTLRSQADADLIAAAARRGARAIVVGASFIGMEVAASLRERGLDITVAAPGTVPFERALGRRIGRLFQGLHEEHGVAFRMGTRVARIEGGHSVEGVTLDGGDRLAADLVVVGVGVAPATSFIEDLPLADDGGVPVDARLQAADGLFAAGDIAEYPDARSGVPVRIEHWRVAQQHGRLAARSMLGEADSTPRVPFFWTEQYDIRLGYVGHHAGGRDAEVFWGAPEDRRFLAFYGDRGSVTAVAGMARDTELAAAEELLRLGRMPPLDVLRSETVDLAALLETPEPPAPG